jgi:hypothetical protein
LPSKSVATSATTWQTASLSMSLKPSESVAMWHTTSAGRWHPRQQPGGVHVSIQVASTSAAMSHQSTTIRDDFILSRIVSRGLGCMGLGLLRDDPDTSRIATFIKGTSRDLINNAHSTTKM